jgi:hypothetical protein
MTTLTIDTQQSHDVCHRRGGRCYFLHEAGSPARREGIEVAVSKGTL